MPPSGSVKALRVIKARLSTTETKLVHTQEALDEVISISGSLNDEKVEVAKEATPGCAIGSREDEGQCQGNSMVRKWPARI